MRASLGLCSDGGTKLNVALLRFLSAQCIVEELRSCPVPFSGLRASATKILGSALHPTSLRLWPYPGIFPAVVECIEFDEAPLKLD